MQPILDQLSAIFAWLATGAIESIVGMIFMLAVINISITGYAGASLMALLKVPPLCIRILSPSTYLV